MSDDQATPRLPQATLDAFCREILQGADVPPEGAAVVAHSLCEADARGLGSHGAARLLPVYVRRLLAGTTRARPHMNVAHRRGAIAVLDGDAGLGQVVG